MSSREPHPSNLPGIGTPLTNLSAVGHLLIGESQGKDMFRFALKTKPPAARRCITTAVPRLLHFVWLHSPLPKRYASNILRQSELNPGWQVRLWLEHPLQGESAALLAGLRDGALAVRNVTEYLRSGRFRNGRAIERWRNPGGKSDFVRMEVVYAEGGIYQDTDAVALRSFDSVGDGSLFRWPWVSYSTRRWKNVCNCAFAFEKASPFLDFALDLFGEICAGPPHAPRLPPSISCTNGAPGPMMLTRALREYGDPEIVLLPGAFVVGPRINHSVTTHTMDAAWHRFPKR
tara:strand:+ start:2006 stop:2872 length:867 start_codon:yes stop_codon:yes gene_type:complete